MTAETPARTPPYTLYLELGAEMVPSAGYDVSMQYPTGVPREYLHTRKQTGLLDVSHTDRIRLVGTDAALTLKSLAPVDISDLLVGQQHYALSTDEQGGIPDDLMVANPDDCLLLAVNTAYKHQDLTHLRRHLEGCCSVEPLFEERASFALQGPAAVRALERLAPQVTQMTSTQLAHAEPFGQDYYVSRSGYTGEDDYEVSVPAAYTKALARRLLVEPEMTLIGLGAYDSLRSEAGLYLYSRNMDSATMPVEASLGWAISEAHHANGMRADGFPGAEWIFVQQAQGVASKCVGFLPQRRMPMRKDAEIADVQGWVIGKVGNGDLGPSPSTPLTMGYAPSGLAGLGSEATAIVRGKSVTLVTSKMSPITQRYYRG